MRKKRTALRLSGCISIVTACLLLTGSIAQAQPLNNGMDKMPAVSAGDSVSEAEMVKGTSEEKASGLEKDYILGREMTEEEKQRQLELHDFYINRGGYIELEGQAEDIQLSTDSLSLVGASIPTAYDSRNVNGVSYITPVRNQNPYGTCWAFAAMACVEANLIKNGYADASVDLSERHLVYFSSHSVPDELGNSGDESSYYAGSDSVYDAGGNTVLAYRALAAWRGAVQESFLPYRGIPEAPGTDAATVYDNDYAHLTGYYRISGDDTNAIKKAIMEYGAVSMSYYSSGSYLNPETAAYYCNVAYSVNHAVTIVGWDDSYSKNNFNIQPTTDGAWLVKNSWGTWYGDEGYFWISYEDKSISSEMNAYEVELADNYDNNYQYDTVTGGMVIMRTSGKMFSSVFTAKANEGKQERLSAVSIELNSPAEVTYSLQIYKNLQDSSDPTSGIAMLTTPQTGVFELAGYHTIPLQETVMLEQGETFSVVFELTKEGSDRVYVAIESDAIGKYYSDATAESGQNFISDDGSYWRDYGAGAGRNLRLKAFTDNADTVLAQEIQLNKESLVLIPGQRAQLTATVLPGNTVDKRFSWSSSDEAVVKVDANGKVTALKDGSATIMARAKDGSGVRAVCEIKVRTIYPPGFQVAGVVGGRRVTFQTQTEDAVIYYSTSSSTLTTADRCVQNGESIVVKDFYGTLYARAYCDGIWSNVARLVLKIPVVKTPEIIQNNDKVTIKTATPNCTIYYTTDGSTPTPNHGTKVNGSSVTVHLGQGTVKAIAVRSCFTNSDIAVKKLVYPVDANLGVPKFRVVGTIGGRKVTFSSDTADGTIYYSTGSNITTQDNRVQNGGSVDFSDFYGTLYARTYKNGKWSNVSRLILKIPTINTPVITASTNGYVTIRTSTPGCAIYYTTDGTTPSPSNGRKINASSAIVYVGNARTVKAIAVRSCFTNSEVTSYTQ